jgi:hypothetical protein
MTGVRLKAKGCREGVVRCLRLPTGRAIAYDDDPAATADARVAKGFRLSTHGCLQCLRDGVNVAAYAVAVQQGS